jgi:hypothetical protein
VIALKELCDDYSCFCFIYYYQKSIILAGCFVDLVQVTGDNLEEAIVKVVEGNILDEI